MIEFTSSKLNSDRGLSLGLDQVLNISDTHIRHIAQLYSPLIVTGSYSRHNSNSMAVGDWFEKNYIEQFFHSSELKHFFDIYKGFKSSSKDRKYDCDMILISKKHLKIYFLQIKYRSKPFHYSSHDEYQELIGRFKKNDHNDVDSFEESALFKGLKQLIGLRSFIDHDSVINQIVNSVGRNVIDKNKLKRYEKRFLLLHTITSADFLLVKGIACYEWNVFRNLVSPLRLKRLLNEHGVVGNFDLEEPPNLESPDEVMDYLENLDSTLKTHVELSGLEYFWPLSDSMPITERLATRIKIEIDRQRRWLILSPKRTINLVLEAF